METSSQRDGTRTLYLDEQSGLLAYFLLDPGRTDGGVRIETYSGDYRELVGTEDLKGEDGTADRHDEHRDRQRHEQIDRRGHAAEIRPSLDGVADQHADQDWPQQPACVVILDDREQAFASDLPELEDR